MHKQLIIANWKMNLGLHEASVMIHKLADDILSSDTVQVVVAPTTLVLQPLSREVDHKTIKLAAQNLYWRDSGAFTGEVSAAQLKGIADYAIIGHSERRHIFGEKNKVISLKVEAAIRNEIKPVLCVGETDDERQHNETKDVLVDQVASGLANVTKEELAEVAIAYEPVWAIGTGNNASTQDVTEAVEIIKTCVKQMFGDSANVPVLYGGSTNPDNAEQYINIDNVSGLLVGGASLDETSFASIVELAQKRGQR